MKYQPGSGNTFERATGRGRQLVEPRISGSAVVVCLHDRVKREVTTLRQVVELGLSVGQVYDAKQHKLHTCSCCENLFVDPSDVPRYCHACRGPLAHAPGGPLPEPKGVVDG